MLYFLYISLAYLLVASIILWMNTNDFTPLFTVKKTDDVSFPSVSICIPARNEESTIGRAVNSALTQNYSNFEVLVLNDRSTDLTGQLLNNIQKNENRIFRIIQGKSKPSNWLGKSWACHQLSKKANGEILFFLDADAFIKPETVMRTVFTMQLHEIDFLTVWPRQHLITLAEKAIIPLIYYALLSLLPVRYVYKDPRWLPKILRKYFSTYFAAACGQCMVFKKEAYNIIGGHKTVKSRIVEDVALAQNIKKRGFKMRMYHGKNSVSCRMYTSHKEIWNGLRKNFLGGFNYSFIGFGLAGLLHITVYILPFIFLIIALINQHLAIMILSLTAILLMLVHRFILAWWYNWSFLAAFTQPLAVIWFQLLGVRLVLDYFKGNNVQWKERSVKLE